MPRVLALILAGGRGQRMDSLCQERAKPTLPFGGRFRVIDFSLSNCTHSRVTHVAALTDHLRYLVADYFRSWYLTSGSHRNVDILEPRRGSYHGTADAVYQNLDYLQRYKPDAVLVLAADHVYKMDYRKLLAFHEQRQADVTVGVVSVAPEQAHRFGMVAVDDAGRMMEFVEKPRTYHSNLASMGIYVFDPRALFERVLEDAATLDSPHDFGHAIIPGMVKRDRVFAYKFTDYWEDIGTPESYYQANMRFIRQQVSRTLDGTWPIFTEQGKYPPPKMYDPDDVRDSIISPGCVVRGRVENSVLSPGVWVEENAVVKDSIVMANSFVGYHSVVDRCILDEGVRVGQFCYVGLGSSRSALDDSITIVGRDASVASNTAIVRGTRVPPHSKPRTSAGVLGATERDAAEPETVYAMGGGI